ESFSGLTPSTSANCTADSGLSLRGVKTSSCIPGNIANEGKTAVARFWIVVGCSVEVAAAICGLRDRSLEERIRPEAGTPRTIHTTAANDKGAIHPACQEREGLRLQQAMLRCKAWASSSAYLPGGRYPVPLAFRIASRPSSMV